MPMTTENSRRRAPANETANEKVTYYSIIIIYLFRAILLLTLFVVVTDSGERTRRTNKKGNKKDSKSEKEETEFMIVQSGTARNAMEIIVGNPEWSDYIIEADLRNIGNRYLIIIYYAYKISRISQILLYPTSPRNVYSICGCRSWGHPGVIFHAQDVNNYEVIYFRPHSFHSGTWHALAPKSSDWFTCTAGRLMTLT
jgi:hypothetical protein